MFQLHFAVIFGSLKNVKGKVILLIEISILQNSSVSQINKIK
jgi:hypothetical protein